MQENLLHFIWKYKRLQLVDMVTSNSEAIDIIDVGTHNHQSGPDFFNAKVKIEGQLWAGNVEIHIKSSDWYVHQHEKDANYDNVILHVVWEDDASIFRKDGSIIPTLELNQYVSEELLLNYQNLFNKKNQKFINCEASISVVDDFTFRNWLERLYFERLERKSVFVSGLLEESKNNWEQVLFAMLLKNFGLKINGESFLSLGNALDFSVVRKLKSEVSKLESVFFGMSHLLNDDSVLDAYFIQLKKEYQYQKQKFELRDEGVLKPEFFKLRPPNFPTIRLSQLANLYYKNQNLFDSVIHTDKISELYSIFDVEASPYWKDHYTFGKISKKSTKKLTRNFIDLLVINTILPLKFCYARYYGKEVNDDILSIISQIKPEENSIISNFKGLGVHAENAKESQATLQLYNEYCSKNKCLQCAVGTSLLSGND